MHLYFIINPLSGRGRGLKLWQQLSAVLHIECFSFEHHITTYAGHAKQLAMQAATGKADVVVVFGGDGTLHEAANGLLSSTDFDLTKTALTVLPLGTGNDFAAAYGLTADLKALLYRLKNPRFQYQDVIRITNANLDIHYCVSMAGWGFDAYVARLANEQKVKGKRGKSLYIQAALQTVRQYKPQLMTLYIDGNQLTRTILSGAAGIHRSNGGGLLQCPEALRDDGLMHLTLIKPLSLWDILTAVPRLFSGSIQRHPRVETFATRSCRIESEQEVYLETDGEDAGLLPVEMIIEEKRLKVLI